MVFGRKNDDQFNPCAVVKVLFFVVVDTQIIGQQAAA